MVTDYVDSLRSAGLRVTPVRLAAMEAIAGSQHADVSVIAAAVKARLGTVSTQAVYDVVNALTGADLVRRVSIDGSAMRYELEQHDNHHHLICRTCGRLEDVQCRVGAAPCLLPEEHHGFDVEVADVIFRGLCSTCRGTTSA